MLVGDFLYSRAFQMMVGLKRIRVLEILAETTNVIAEGEVLQLMNAGDADLDEDAYLDVIQRKTAKLFEAAARLGAVLGDADAGRSRTRLPATACTSAPRSSWSTTCSTTRAAPTPSARTWATTWPKAR